MQHASRFEVAPAGALQFACGFSPITAAVRLSALRTAQRLVTWGDVQTSETAAIPAATLPATVFSAGRSSRRLGLLEACTGR